jgi:hypothetical protein
MKADMPSGKSPGCSKSALLGSAACCSDGGNEQHRQRLAEWVRQTPDATLDELRLRLGAPVSRATIGRAVLALGLRLKKRRCTPVSKIDPT